MAGERKLPGMGLTGFWNLKSAYKDDMDDNLRRLSVLVQGHVDSRPASVPGSPAQGAIVIPTTGANAGKIAVYDAGAWVYLVPFAGVRLFDRGTATFIYFDGTAWREEEAGEVYTFLGLSDTPDAFGTPGQVVSVNAAGNGLVFSTPATGGGGGEALPAYRYWRYRITATRGSGYIALGEWELRTPDGTNVARGKAVTSSRAGTDAGKITDGIKANGNFWESPGNAVPCDLTLDLGAAHVITDARFYMTNDWPQQVPTTGKLLASVSGVDGSWVEVADVPVSPAMALPNEVAIPIQVAPPQKFVPTDGSISGLRAMTEAAYSALTSKDASVLYVVKGSASIKLYLGTVPLAV